MILEAFGHEYPFWLAPLNTTLLLLIFLYLSYRETVTKEKDEPGFFHHLFLKK